MTTKRLPIIAIIGPANAGKSSLLNKVSGGRLAVTSDLAGTTRDRQYIDTSWNGKSFALVDTAGFTDNRQDELEQNINKQIDLAVAEADILLLVVDGRQPRSSINQSALKKIRKQKKPLLLAVNKLEALKERQEKLAAFQSLGIKSMFGVSALSGVGLGDLLDAIAELAGKVKTNGAELKNAGISVAIVGKPNVGKSSVFNQILQEERVVVSPVPGTTRTAIDSRITIADINYTFIDTAGLKKKEYRQAQADIFSGFQTFKSIRRSDVCFFVIDATEEITKQDQRIAQEIFSQQKGCVILANKMDVYKGSQEKLRDYLSLHFPFLWMCPVFFVSGKTGQGLSEAIAATKPIFERRGKEIDNQTLSEFLNQALKKNSPKLLRDQKKPKVFSLHQYDVNPPSFELLVNHPAAISMQFRKFLENSIIKHLDFWGTPIVLRLRGKDKT
ncbi:MAG: ribosome biogenesis GTPase Der [Patescibacteria group bacterium]|nr:ribosome biogenesis GTPase Der [Patescibacteria group bacterium]